MLIISSSRRAKLFETNPYFSDAVAFLREHGVGNDALEAANLLLGYTNPVSEFALFYIRSLGEKPGAEEVVDALVAASDTELTVENIVEVGGSTVFRIHAAATMPAF